MTHLRSLTLSLDVRGASALDEQRLMGFIYRLPKLEHLSVVCWTRLLMTSDLLKYRNESLITLKLHEDTDYTMILTRFSPNEENVRRLGRNCSLLETYAIDVNAGAEWVESLATQDRIKSVKVILSSVQEIWNFLWTNIARVRKNKNHIISQPRLRTLQISIKDPSRDTIRFAARLCERDDLTANGHADVVCLEL
ncbi:MAG: hypothetical protein Q9192_004967 [Flavoplaca navasiana]